MEVFAGLAGPVGSHLGGLDGVLLGLEPPLGGHLALEGSAGQPIVAVADGQLGALGPLLDLGGRLVVLGLPTLQRRHRGRLGVDRLVALLPHLRDELREHLLGVLHAIEKCIDLGHCQAPDALEEANHRASPFFKAPEGLGSGSPVHTTRD